MITVGQLPSSASRMTRCKYEAIFAPVSGEVVTVEISGTPPPMIWPIAEYLVRQA
ncbi:unnamed protein product [Acidithrix sp. C25]|nr:unnamed protein product [Acidithrix sp. C25]